MLPASAAFGHPCPANLGPAGQARDPGPRGAAYSPGRAGGEWGLTHTRPGRGLAMPGEARQILAQNLRLLRFHRRWSQETLGFEAGSRSRLPGSRDISAVASGSCPLATLLRPCRASMHVIHRTYISQIEKGKSSAAPMLPASAALVRPWTSRFHRQHRETRPRPRPYRLRAPAPAE